MQKVDRCQIAINRSKKSESFIFGSRTAETQKKQRCERAINRTRKKLQLLASSGSWRKKRSSYWDRCMIDFRERKKRQKEYDAELERLFRDGPERDVSEPSFVERPFGSPLLVCEGYGQQQEQQSHLSPASSDVLKMKLNNSQMSRAGYHQGSYFSPSLVSLALFDEDKLLFACSGIALPSWGRREYGLSRFVTSACLVRKFIEKRNRADKLRIEVVRPDNRHINGFLGLYDEDIAIVTSLGLSGCDPVCVNPEVPHHSDQIEIVGRAFKSGNIMLARGNLMGRSTINMLHHLVNSTCDITEAGLGGPVIGNDGYIVGLSLFYDEKCTWILPGQLLHERLEWFKMVSPNTSNLRGYTLPSGVYSIVPSGLMKRINFLKSLGYPKPPPLVLEFNGQLRNTFEKEFGQLCAWAGYDADEFRFRGSREHVLDKLPKKVVTNISRSVVSLASFNGDVRSFACTGLLIKWHTKTTCAVILTSASLVKNRDDEDKIDENLRIDVFLPPNQRAEGKLELYHSDYNIAIISVHTCLRNIRPANIFCSEKKSPGQVVAIGRQVRNGYLMATMGEVTDRPRIKPSKVYCEDLKLSTCQIQKTLNCPSSMAAAIDSCVGIGGPLVNFGDGSFAGMNFYDDTDKTPFLPRDKIVEVLGGTDLPSQRGSKLPLDIMGDATVKKNRWPVPEAYWYNSPFDVDGPPLIPPHVGRVPQ